MDKYCPNCMRITRQIRVKAGNIRCEVCGRESSAEHVLVRQPSRQASRIDGTLAVQHSTAQRPPVCLKQTVRLVQVELSVTHTSDERAPLIGGLPVDGTPAVVPHHDHPVVVGHFDATTAVRAIRSANAAEHPDPLASIGRCS